MQITSTFSPQTLEMFKHTAVEPREPEVKTFDHDIEEVAVRFSRPATAAYGVKTVLSGGTPNDNFGTTTMGPVTFRNVAPLEHHRSTVVTASQELQQRLEMLCDSLRSKY